MIFFGLAECSVEKKDFGQQQRIDKRNRVFFAIARGLAVVGYEKAGKVLFVKEYTVAFTGPHPGKLGRVRGRFVQDVLRGVMLIGVDAFGSG